MFLKILAVLVLLLFTSACARQAVFLSQPVGAKVIVNGEQVGVTPCRFHYQTSPGTHYEVTIEKDGYEAVHQKIHTDEIDRGIRNRWLTAGLVWSPLWLGTFFSKKLKENYEFILKKDAAPPRTQLAKEGTGRLF
ncbi:MAG TPA: PEGA domain-containing protein [Desulfuromonadales bacterium]|nr:PEGA domain-containing protein [Desulfuromonadales bacterium]